MARIFQFILIFIGVGILPATGQSIPALTFDLKKPAKFEDRKLGSEKTAEKKYTIPRRIIQNTVTKFNWHFNANEKLKQLIFNAKSNFKDDYTQLLPFYNFTTDQTVKDTLELDSIIYKSNAGILLHDLRNGWIDNLYLIMGKAYFYSQEYDTAYLIFQYINYAFSPKEKDGYDKVIGSNANEGGNAFSISTPEKRDIIKFLFSHRPSRNESFLWLIRTNLARGEFAEAGGMIETLKNDPFYPQRLHPTLDELQAFSYYLQENYDSAVVYLERALPNAENRFELARWEFLLGQLYERIHKSTEAQHFFQLAAQHSPDPILEVYARLHSIRQNITDEAIDENIRDLVRMARRDKYLSYRDIIYYAAAQMELERKGTEAAKKLLLLSTQSSSDQSVEKMQKSKSFLLLGDLSYNDGNYTAAKDFYDSVLNPEVVSEPELFNKRKEVLGKMVANEKIIFRQDSLQHIAALPDAEREALIKKMVRKIKKEQGLQEEETTLSTMSGNQPLNPTAAPPVSFDNNTKGDWYFYNTSLKTRGYTEFRSKWGNRPNVDNWRRAASVTQALQLNTAKQDAGQEDTTTAPAPRGNKIYESLVKALPLTPVQLKISNDSILNAKMEIAIALTDGLEDYPSAINVLDSLREQFPKSEREPDALLYLIYCYDRSGNKAKAAYYKKLLDQEYTDSESSKKLAQLASQSKSAPSNIEMTRRYEKIYRLFIEGQFEQALAEKREADAKYQKNYWTPQLLYIQSVYWIRERKDDSAIAVLNDIIKLYAASPLATKAKTMVDVLKRRSEIENYLNNLKIDRPREEVVQTIPDELPVPAPPQKQNADPLSQVAQPVIPAPVQQQNTDTLSQVASPAVQAPAVNEPAQKTEKEPAAPEKAAVVDTLQAKPAPAPVENKNAAQDKNVAEVQKPKEEPAAPPVQTKEKENTAVIKDTAGQNKPLVKEPLPPPVKTSAPLAEKTAVRTMLAYEPDTESPHSVIVILEKVDGIFVNEAKNAFNLYNRQAFYNKSFTITQEVFNETIKLIRIESFANANEALAYMEKVRKVADADIIPWLPVEKYRFIISSDKNLETLRSKKDLLEYNTFLRSAFPGKF